MAAQVLAALAAAAGAGQPVQMEMAAMAGLPMLAVMAEEGGAETAAAV